MARIVVGVDGSENSIIALRWAVEEARLHDAELTVVIAWQYPYTGDIGMAHIPPINAPALEESARKAIEDHLAEVVPSAADRERIERVFVYDTPSHALIEESKGADLLVVGTRGRGGFRGLLLGSVSQQCLNHATCPVAVIPCPD